MASDPETALSMLPGPVPMHPRVLQAMARQAMGHRTPAFTAINERLFGHLRTLTGTPHVAAVSGSGTAGMEAVISNLVHWGDRPVGIDAGKFGARMAELAARHAGEMATTITVPWGQAVDVQEVAAALEEGATAVCITLNETSTGVMHDGAAIGRLARKHDALYLADTITATGSVPVPFDAWGLDAVVFGSQKCIGGPSGLAFVGLSKRAIDRLDSPGVYLDLRRYLDKAREGQTPFTPAIPLHVACAEALDMVLEEGLEARYARTSQVAAACRAATRAAGLELAAVQRHSDTVTAIRYPEGLDDGLRTRLAQDHDVLVAGAQDAWKGKVMRIGHMAGTTWRDIAACWMAITATLEASGRPVDVAAVAEALAANGPTP